MSLNKLTRSLTDLTPVGDRTARRLTVDWRERVHPTRFERFRHLAHLKTELNKLTRTMKIEILNHNNTKFSTTQLTTSQVLTSRITNYSLRRTFKRIRRLINTNHNSYRILNKIIRGTKWQTTSKMFLQLKLQSM
jgi:hypothetical protein